MKKLFVVWVILAAGLRAMAAGEVSSAIAGADAPVWAGIDFSLIRMIGAGDFNDASAIFPGFLDSWNNLFLKERIKVINKTAGKIFSTDIGGVTERNKAATSKQIINSPGADDTIDKSHITADDIAKEVKSLKMDAKAGTALLMIADRFVKQDKKGDGAVYVVVFDIASRKVLASQREVQNAMGIGFRNYWFRVIKESEAAIKKAK